MPARILFDNGDGLTLDMQADNPALLASKINEIISDSVNHGPLVRFPAIIGGETIQILIRISDIARVVVT